MLNLAAALAYAGAAAAAWRRHSGFLAAFAGVALLMHATVLWQQLWEGGTLRIGLGEAVSLILWQAALLLMLAWRQMPIRLLALACFPVAAVAVLVFQGQGLDQVLGQGQRLDLPAAGISDWTLQLHAGLSIFAAGLFTLTVLQSLLLAVQNRFLHHADGPGWARELPPLLSMETALFRALWLAWFVLGLALLTGIVFVDDLFAQHLVHKTVLSFLSWAVFAVLLWGHWRYGWRGRTALRWTWTGYAVLLVAYFGSRFVLEVLLGERWG